MSDERKEALGAAAGSARTHDVNLCDPCMDALGVDKQRAWMGHCSDDGDVECDMCGAMEARLCFRVASGTRTNLPHAEKSAIEADGRMRVEWPSLNAQGSATGANNTGERNHE